MKYKVGDKFKAPVREDLDELGLIVSNGFVIESSSGLVIINEHILGFTFEIKCEHMLLENHYHCEFDYDDSKYVEYYSEKELEKYFTKI